MDWLALLDKAVIPIVIAVLAPILYMLARKALETFQEKTGLEVSKEHEAMLEKLVGRGIAYAEEQARKAIKSGDEKPDSDSKLDMAIDFIKSNADSLGLDAKTDDLAKLIEAKLFEDRPESSAGEGLEAPAASEEEESDEG